ncbi:MAG: oxidoreductase [Deltaproteobacteria bacterium]|nr:oxidoreductase [Deltaproteobacteria bacterium]
MNEVGVYEAMRSLRAVRKLRPDPVPTEVLNRVLEAATWAPTGANTQPWRVVVVKAAAPKKQLGELYARGWKRYSDGHRAHLSEMPEDIRPAQERILAAGDYLADHFGESPVLAVFCFNPKMMAITDIKLDRVSVVGGGSIYPAVENLLLACRAEGLGCTLTTLLCGYEDRVKEILGIPSDWGTACTIPIGYPVGTGHGPITRKPIEKLAFLDRWKNTYSD